MSRHDTTAMALTEDKVLLRFWYDSAENAVVSAQEGRAIFDTVLLVELLAPGQSASTPVIELERAWAPESLAFYGWEEGTTRKNERYYEFEQYIEKFKRNNNQLELGGTPLKEWPRVTQGLVATLAAQGIYTVEQVSAIPDANLNVLGAMGGRELREQAIAFLAEAKGSADTSKLVAQIASLQETVQRLQSDLLAANQAAAVPSVARASKPAQKAATLPDIGPPVSPSSGLTI